MGRQGSRRAVLDAAVDQALREVCLEIEVRYQIKLRIIKLTTHALRCTAGCPAQRGTPIVLA